MKREQFLIPFSQEHHTGLVVALLIQKKSPRFSNLPDTIEGKKQYLLETFKNELLPHFEREEELLIEGMRYQAAESSDYSRRVLNEHTQMKSMIEEIRSTEAPIELMDTFGTLLEQHIRYEEREWFQYLQEMTSQEQKDNVLQSLNREQISGKNCQIGRKHSEK